MAPSWALVTQAALLWLALAVTSSRLPDDLGMTSSLTVVDRSPSEASDEGTYEGWKQGTGDDDRETKRGRGGEEGRKIGVEDCLYEGRDGAPRAPEAKKMGNDSQAETTTPDTASIQVPGKFSRNFHHLQPRSTGDALRILQDSLWTAEDTLFLEVVVVADYSMYRKYGWGAYERVRDIVSVASAFYRQLDIVLLLTEIKLWSYGDEVSISSDRHRTLDGLKTYREKLLKDETHIGNDITVLITQMDYEEVAGVANTGYMCSHSHSSHSLAIVQDSQSNPGIAGHILAHEVGHSIGIKHDEDGDKETGGECHCATKKCLMSAVVTSEYDPSVSWSSCSRRKLHLQREAGVLHCLKNLPTQVVADSNCGNYLVEEGEQCDCGPTEFCRNRCCDPKTCKLVGNATCASGACCDTETCRPLKAGNVCRTARSECDLPEFCSGHSETCPDDLYKADGMSCLSERGHCFKGKCGSHDLRCREVWGDYAYSSPKECYSTMNTAGNSDGNCGAFGNQYSPCDEQSVMCGTLYCIQWSQKGVRLHGHHYNVTEVVGSTTCSFVVGAEHYPSSHWLSPNGAQCGRGKMCVDQKCVKVPSAEGNTQPSDQCSGHGVRNNRGNCHCDPGFDPPHCASPGMGGSIDSGPATRAKGKGSIAALVICILFVLLLTILAVLFCLWGRLRRCWENQGRAKISPVFPQCASCIDTCCCPIMSKVTHWMVTATPLGRQPKNFRKEMRPVDVQTNTENGRTICQVDLDFGGRQRSETNSWGVASERLVTEVVTFEPRESPELHRKIQLPSDSSSIKSADSLKRPKYMQSVSVDSGCVLDSDEANLSESSSLNLSMKSLVSAFMKYGTKTQNGEQNRNSRKSINIEVEKVMPLSRIVVDPFVNNRRSRQGTPPPIPTQPPTAVRPSYGRSISVDAAVAKGRPNTAPPPVPPTHLKARPRENGVHVPSKLAANPFIQSQNQKRRSSSTSSTESVGSSGRARTPSQTSYSEMTPTKTSVTRPTSRLSPSRDPPLPSVTEASESALRKPLRPPPKRDVPPGKRNEDVALRHSAPRSSLGATRTSYGTSPTGPNSENKADSKDSGKAKKVMDLARKFEQK